MALEINEESLDFMIRTPKRHQKIFRAGKDDRFPLLRVISGCWEDRDGGNYTRTMEMYTRKIAVEGWEGNNMQYVWGVGLLENLHDINTQTYCIFRCHLMPSVITFHSLAMGLHVPANYS